ncbi:hypothetical protein MXB_1281, partial [Myxobolus squamalis]
MTLDKSERYKNNLFSSISSTDNGNEENVVERHNNFEANISFQIRIRIPFTEFVVSPIEHLEETVRCLMDDQRENDNISLNFETIRLFLIYFFPAVNLTFFGISENFEERHFQNPESYEEGRKKFVYVLNYMIKTIAFMLIKY